MADLAASAVTTELGWKVVSTPFQVTYKLLTLALTSQGDGTDTIDATTLGFNRILGCTEGQLDTDATFRSVVPSYDGSKLFVYSHAVSTDADRPKPLATTATIRLTVWGI